MDAQRQLYWLQRNRGPRCRDQSIGGWVRRLISQPAWDRLDQAGQLAEALGALVDDEFRQHAPGRRLRRWPPVHPHRPR